MSFSQEDEVVQCGSWNEVSNEKRSYDYWIHNKI